MNVFRTKYGTWRVRVKRDGVEYGRSYARCCDALRAAAALRQGHGLPHRTSKLCVEPFAAWLQALPCSTAEIARELRVDERRVQRLRKGAQPHVTNRLVERWGIALVDDPGLVERLYDGLPSSPSPG